MRRESSDEEFLAVFRLPHKGAGALDEQEDRIMLCEETHKYTFDGKLVPRSVTGFLHEYASSFDPALALQSMRAGRDWAMKKASLESQGLGTEDADFLQRWSKNGETTRARGHLLHYQARVGNCLSCL